MAYSLLVTAGFNSQDSSSVSIAQHLLLTEVQWKKNIDQDLYLQPSYLHGTNHLNFPRILCRLIWGRKAWKAGSHHLQEEPGCV